MLVSLNELAGDGRDDFQIISAHSSKVDLYIYPHSIVNSCLGYKSQLLRWRLGEPALSAVQNEKDLEWLFSYKCGES